MLIQPLSNPMHGAWYYFHPATRLGSKVGQRSKIEPSLANKGWFDVNQSGSCQHCWRSFKNFFVLRFFLGETVKSPHCYGAFLFHQTRSPPMRFFCPLIYHRVIFSPADKYRSDVYLAVVSKIAPVLGLSRISFFTRTDSIDGWLHLDLVSKVARCHSLNNFFVLSPPIFSPGATDQQPAKATL